MSVVLPDTSPTSRRVEALRARVAGVLRVAEGEVREERALTGLGLDSLAAVELQHALEAGGAEVAIDELLEGMTFGELVERLGKEKEGEKAEKALGEEDLRGARDGGRTSDLATHGQRALWFLERVAPGNGAYHIVAAARVRGEMDAGALRRAFAALVARHEALRTVYPEVGGEPRARVLAEGGLDFAEEEGAGWSDGQALAWLGAEAYRAFDLERGPLVRVRLLQRDSGERMLLFAVHHIAADFWSLAVALRDLGELYRAERSGTRAGLPPAPGFRAQAASEAARLAGDMEEAWSYWREALAGELPVLALPADRPRPPARTYRGGAVALRLSRGQIEAFRDAARRAETTLFTQILSVFSVLLLRLTGQSDLVLGTPTSGREGAGGADLAAAVGYFVNPVPLRLDLSGDPTFAELRSRARRAALGAFAHSSLPFPLLAERLQPARDPSRTPIFQAMLTLLSGERLGQPGLAGLSLGEGGEPVALGDLFLEPLALPERRAPFDLALDLAELPSGALAVFGYDADLLDRTTARRLAGWWERLAAGALAEPDLPLSALPLLAPAERHQLAVEWNDTAPVPAPAALLHELVLAQAARTPEAVAIVSRAETLTYAELAARAERLAAALRARGIGPETAVALCVERDAAMVVDLLAVLVAGGAYLPLDPSLPDGRIAALLAESRAPWLLAGEGLVPRLSPLVEGLPASLVAIESLVASPEAPPRTAGRAFLPPPRLAPESLAYVLYTSGSTGAPKGVAIAHRSAVAMVRWAREVFTPAELDGVLAATSLGFDLSVFEIFVPLAWGGRVVVAANALELPRLPAEARVALVNTVPSVLAELLAGGALPAALPATVRTVSLAGEPLPAPLAAAARAAGARRVLNLYGPSEDTTYSTFAEVAAEDALPPIGRPIAASRAYVLDAAGRLAPPGAVGELFLAGEGLARGYLHRPELTAERFLPDPFSSDPAGGRLYATGDLVRLRPSGELEYLGRRDQQVKVRGVRIELGEVEAALAAHPAVRGAAVLAARPLNPGEAGKRLVAYLASDPADSDELLSSSSLRAFLRARLPEAMVPAGFVLLPELPRTASGKVDRRALARLDWTPEAAGEEGREAPRGAVAEILAGLWAELLAVPAGRLGGRDDFFALGGHSLAAARLLSRVRERLGVDVPLAALLADPTLGGLARLVEAALAGGARAPLPPIDPRAGVDAPLTPAQRRLWFLAQMAPESAAYHLPAAIRLRGRLAAGALAAALGEIVRRHEALRTTIVTDAGEPVARPLPSSPVPFALPVADLAALPPDRREGELGRLAREEALRPFDLARGPLARFRFLGLEEREHVLLATFHHLVADGASLAVFERELAALYGAFAAGRPLPLAPPAVQHGDYAAWQAEHEAAAAAADLPYWRERLADAPQELPLPFEPMPGEAPSAPARAAFVARDLSPAAVAALSRLAREAGATRFMVLAAAVALLLGRFSGVDDLLLGTPVARRRQPELAGAIGLFVDTLALRAELGGDPPVAELVARLRREVLSALAHQDLPFERLVEELATERDPGRMPLVQAVLTLEPPLLAASFAGLDLALLPREPTEPKFDLAFQVIEEEERLRAVVEYPASHPLRRFERTTVARLLSGLDALMIGMGGGMDEGARISSLSPLSPAERQQTLHEWNDTDPRLPRCDLAAAFLRAARRRPEAPALAFEGIEVSYGELLGRAVSVARRLRRLGAGPESVVGLATERSVERIVGLLAIVLAGGAYLPLDPAYPDERLALMVADAGARAIVTHDSLWRGEIAPGVAVLDLTRDAIPAAEASACEPAPAVAESLACVLYTSGSTGRPKGVLVTRGGVLRLIEGADYVDLTPADRVAQVSTLSFDTATFEIWGALLSGACLVLPPPGALSVEALGRFVRQAGVTVLWLTSGLFQQMVESALDDLSGVRQLLAGGDALSVPHVEALLRALPNCRLVDGYGPTENTTFSTCHAMQGDEALGASVPIGRPISGSTAYVLTGGLAPVPIGGVGELWLGGEGLARGYQGDPARTAERFLPDPASGAPGARLYRSGDRARQRADGSLEFLGRLDRQVKVRGFRIELSEVEAALAAHPEVGGAVVEARFPSGYAAGGRRLVAWTTGGAAASDLRRFLLARLPEHAVPSLFVALPALPLTPQGKVDRRALPEPTFAASAEVEAAPSAPRDPIAELVAGLFAEVLGIERVGPDDDFFALGGHSLLATRAVSRLKAALGQEVALAELFAAPTAASLAARLASGAGKALPPIEPLPRSGTAGAPIEAPLSFAQERLWFLDQLEPGSPLYNIAGAVRLSGDLSLPALAASFGEVARRHEALRTRFLSRDGAPVSVVDPPAAVPLPLVDLGGLPEPAREGEARALLAAAALAPFDLARGPLLRPLAVRLGAREHLLLLALHHIAGDGWSIDLLLAEVRALYPACRDGRPSPLAPLAVQYRDVAAWQRGWLQGEALAAEIAAWREALAGAPEALELPADRPRPPVESHRGGEIAVGLDAPLAAALDRLGRRAGATRFMVLLAGFAALLARCSGQEEVVVGTPVANRGRLETERLIGFFVNTLALRVDLVGDPDAAGLLARARRAALAAYAHQDLPFEKLVDELAPRRDLARHPLFQVLLSLEEPRDAAPLAGLAMAPVELEERTAKLDLTLVARPAAGGGLRLALGYARDLFDRTTVLRLGRHLAALLAGLARGGEEPVAAIPLLSEAEAHQLRREWNDSAADWDLRATVGGLVGRRAGERPEAVALEMGEVTITYGELLARAGRLARRLRELGVEREAKVAVLLERGPEIVLSILAIWQAGGVYLPLAAAQPPARLAFLLADAEPAVVLTRGRTVELPARGAHVLDLDGFAWEGGEPAAMPAAATDAAAAADLAYMLYTSGSTGEPKAVLVEQRSLVNLLRALAADLGVGPRDVMASWTTPTFDPSLLEWFLPLTTGARALLLAEEEVLDFPRLASRVREVTLLDGVPGLYQPFVELLEERGLDGGWERVRSVTAGGESVSAHLLAGLRRVFRRAAVRNSYGPTETAVIAANYLAPREGELRGDVVGRPLANVVLRLVDRRGQPVPIGVAGEVWIGGAGVARGYFRRPELTAERFVRVEGERWFKSGDLGRYLADGNLEFLGRLDQQVKIRGVRIEPGEVEAALARHPGVREVAVVARQDGGGERRLVAYVVPRGAPEDLSRPAAAELRAVAAERLPGAMVPAAYVLLAALPRDRNGKLDRRALPPPGAARPDLAAAYAAPRTELERRIAAVWSELLGLERVGIEDSFFELGGNSLAAVRLRSRLERALGRELSIVDLFRHPTVAALAAHLERQEGAPPALDDARAARTAAVRQESLGRLRAARGRRAG